MIIFRPHRTRLAAAMAAAKEFNTVEEMKEHIVKEWNNCLLGHCDLFTVDDVVIDKASASNDVRIGWEDSMYVYVKRMGNKIYNIPQCIGICATKYPRKQ